MNIESNTSQALTVANSQQLSVNNQAGMIDDDVIDTGQIWRTLLRYRNIIVRISITFGVLALLYSMLLRPMYTSSAIIRINKNTSILDVDVDGGFYNGNDWTLQPTVMRLLSGRAVGESIVNNLDLTKNPEFIGKLKQRSFFPSIGIIKGVVSSFFKGNKEDVASRDEAYKREGLLDSAISVYQSRLSIEEVENTELIKLSYTSFNPQVSADILNSVVSVFNELETKNQKELSGSAKKILDYELLDVQRKLQLSEKKLTEFSRKTGIVDLQGSNNIMTSRYNSISDRYIAIQNERMELEIKILNAKNTKDKLVLLSLLEAERVSSRRAELDAMRAEYQRLSGVFKPEYPKLKVLKRGIERLTVELSQEVDLAVKSMIAEYKNLIDRENQLSDELNKSNYELLDLKDRSVALNILKREWESNKNLYEGLLEKVKRASLAANLEMNKLSLVEKAVVPNSKSSPNITKNIVLSTSVGAFFALGIAFLLALLDRQFRSIKEIEDHAHLPVLAVVPQIKKETDDTSVNHVALLSHLDPSGVVGETFRSFRTSLMYSMPGEKLNTMMITSSGPSEGKSSSMVNLSITLAKNGLKVVIIDLDLRKPSLHKVFGCPRAPGFTDTLVNRVANIRKTEVDDLYIIPAGTSSPNPTEMLESRGCRKFIDRLKQEFDVVMFDSPPVMGLADALILSQFSKVVVMAVDISQTNKDNLKNSLNRLRRVNAPIAGMLVTRHYITQTDDYSDSSYHYYNYNYSYKEIGYDDDKPNKTKKKDKGRARVI